MSIDFNDFRLSKITSDKKHGTWWTIRRILYDNDGRKVVLIGKTEGKKCKECQHFYYDQRAKVYRRCEFYPKKSWKANWEACSQFAPDKQTLKEST